MIIPLLLEPVVPLGDVNLAADDGLHVGVLLGILEELLYAVHVAVIRDGKRRHSQLIGPVKEVLYGGLSIQDGVLGMDVKVYETHKAKIRFLPRICAKKLSTITLSGPLVECPE